MPEMTELAEMAGLAELMALLHLSIPNSNGGSLWVGGRIVEKGDVSGMDALTKKESQPMVNRITAVAENAPSFLSTLIDFWIESSDLFIFCA